MFQFLQRVHLISGIVLMLSQCGLCPIGQSFELIVRGQVVMGVVKPQFSPRDDLVEKAFRSWGHLPPTTSTS